MPSWPISQRHGQGPRPTTGKRYGIGGFRGMNPHPGSSQSIGRDNSIPIVNKNHYIRNSNVITENSPQFGNRFKKASEKIGSIPMNISATNDTEIQRAIEGKSKAWQYLEKWQHKSNMPKDYFKAEIEHERMRSLDQIAHSRGACSPRKLDNANIDKNKIINKRNRFLGQHSTSPKSLDSRDVYMNEIPPPRQVKRRKMSPRYSSGNQNPPVTLNTNVNLSKYELSSNENISTLLRNKHSKDSFSIHRYPSISNHRTHSPGRSNERYQSVKEFEGHTSNKLRLSYSPDREVIPDRDYSNSKDHSPYNEIKLCSRRQLLVQHISRHDLHHHSQTSDRKISRNRCLSPEFNESPPMVQTPEPRRSFSRQSSPSPELSLSRRRSPRDYEHTKSHSLARRMESSKDDYDEKDLFHLYKLLKKRQSPTRQTAKKFQKIYEEQKPEHAGVRHHPKEYYDFKASKSDKSCYPTSYREKSPMTRGRSPERIVKYKSHRRLSPNEIFHKTACSPARSISPRRCISPRSHEQYSVELSRLSPDSFLKNMNALHKEYSPVLMEGLDDDGYRSREGSRTSSLERLPFSDKRYKDEKVDIGLERYKDSRILEKGSYSHRKSISERLGAALDRPDMEEDSISNFPLELMVEEKEDLRNELLRIKGKRVEEKIRMLEENERETDYKLSVLERKLDGKELEDFSAKMQEKKHSSQISGINRFSRINDIQPRNQKSPMTRKTNSNSVLVRKFDRKAHEDLSTKMQEKKHSSRISGSNRLSRINDIQPSNPKPSMTRNANSNNITSVKHSVASAVAFPRPKKREPTTASFSKQSSSSIQKKKSSPIKVSGKYSPIHW